MVPPVLPENTLASWHFPAITDNRRFDFSSRFGILPATGQKHTDPVDPTGLGWHPWVWNHDRRQTVVRPTITAIGTGSVTTLTLSLAHGRTIGDTIEVAITGVTGADAAQLNRTYVGTFRSTNQVEVPLDSTGLSLTATGNCDFGQWALFCDTISGFLIQNSNTDPSVGGGIRENLDDSGALSAVGIESGFLADAQDYHAPRGERVFCFQHPLMPLMSGRQARTISGATNATEAVLTLDVVDLPRDVGAEFPVVIYGLTGNWAPANGEQTARYLTTTTIELVGVDSSAFGALTGTGRCLNQQRMAPVHAELFQDVLDRLDEAVQGVEEVGGVTGLEVRGVVASYGRREVAADQDEMQRVANIRASSIATGFPTRITLSGPIVFPTIADGRCALHCDITGGPAQLNGRHDFLAIDSTTIDVLVDTTGSIDADAVRIEAGSPSRWFHEDVLEFIDELRAGIETITGQQGSAVPVSLIRPRYLEVAEWDGRGAYADDRDQSQRLQTQIGAVASELDLVGVVDTSDLEVRAATTVGVPRDDLYRLAMRSWEEANRLAIGLARRSRGVPLYFHLGDSLCAGTVSYFAAALSQDENYDGTHDPARAVKVFDFRTGEFEDYTAVTYVGGNALPGNSNTFEVWNSNPAVGADISLFLERTKAHSQGARFVKIGVNGSGITDIRLDRDIDTLTINGSVLRVSVPADQSGAQYGHGRATIGESIVVELEGLLGAGITGVADGLYTATVVDYAQLDIETNASPAGGYTAGAIVKVPQPDWRRSTGDLFRYLEDAITQAFDAIEREGGVPDVRGVFLSLGTNDALFGDADSYLTNMRLFRDDLRDVLTTRSVPSPALPVVLGRLRSNPNYPGGAAVQTAVATIQAAQATFAADDTATVLADFDSVNEADLEITRVPIATDNIHTTMEGFKWMGFILENAFATVDQTCAAVPATESGQGASLPEDDSGGGSSPLTSTAASAAAGTKLDAINAAIDAFLSNGAIQTYTIDGVTVQRAGLADLMQYRDQLQQEVAIEQGSQRNLAVRGND